jgi:DNA-binding response OmpR family regulator
LGEDKTILIVDDDPNLLKLLGNRLKREGYKVTLAANGMKALESIKIQKPQLIIMDLIMPILGGAGVMIALKEDKTTSDIPVFYLTGADVSEVELGVESIGHDMIFRKPFDFKELIQKVRDVLEN